MPDKILTNSVLDVKATAALSQQIAKDLADNKTEKNMKELLDEHQCATGNDRGTSSTNNEVGL